MKMDLCSWIHPCSQRN